MEVRTLSRQDGCRVTASRRQHNWRVILSPELDGKRLHLLHDTFPARRRIAVLFRQPVPATPPLIVPIQASSGEGWNKKSGPSTRRDQKGDPGDVQRHPLAVWSRCPPDCILVYFSGSDAARLAELALKAGLPTICEWRDMAREWLPDCLWGGGAIVPLSRGVLPTSLLVSSWRTGE